MQCPKCKSENVKKVAYQGISCLVCNACGYDERNLYEQYPQEKTSQKAKGSFSPYKAGGRTRAKK